MNTKKIIRKRPLVFTLMGLVALLILAALLSYMGIIWPNSVFAANYKIYGIDVSSYQKKIDWQQVAQSKKYSFVFIKATEGKNYKDAYFQQNWQGSKEHGILRGAYHFFSDFRTGTDQAQNYISMVPREEGMLPPVLDLEVSGKDHSWMLKEITIFLDLLEQHYGLKPIIYADYQRYDEFIRGNFDDHIVWIRDIITPASWSTVDNWQFWQYSNRGRIAGIEGFVDLNIFTGDMEKLKSLRK